MNKCQKFNLFSTRKSLKNSRQFSSNDHINGHLQDRLEKELHDEEDCNYLLRKTSIDKFGQNSTNIKDFNFDIYFCHCNKWCVFKTIKLVLTVV